MADTVDKATRSRMMASVRSKDTKIEMVLRRRLFAIGFRYRLHVRRLPGSPDMVFSRYRAAVFIHGCFWHMHGCRRSKLPETRANWWKDKILSNRERDLSSIRQLRAFGWRVMVVWECSLRVPKSLRQKAIADVANSMEIFIKSHQEYLEIPEKPSTGQSNRMRGKNA